MEKAIKQVEKTRASIRAGRSVQCREIPASVASVLEVVAACSEILDDEDGVSYDD